MIKKLWINSLEKSAVFKGFNNLQDDRKAMMMYEEARARSIADFLVGINASRLYSNLIQSVLISNQKDIHFSSALGGKDGIWCWTSTIADLILSLPQRTRDR